MTENNYSVGSIWRRWDLHIHTPYSSLNNQFKGKNIEEKWESYISKLESLPEDISVIGATDYYSIQGYKRLQQQKKDGRLKNIDLILPNCEARLPVPTEHEGPVNIHFIFNPCIVNELENRFFAHLNIQYDRMQYSCTRESIVNLGRKYKHDNNLEEEAAFKAGCNQFKISIEKISDLLKNNKDLKDNILIGVSNKEDGMSGLPESSLGAMREEIGRMTDIIFSSNPNDREYYLGKKTDAPEVVKRKYDSLKPCIHGSDNHSLDKIGKTYEDRFCWIKADPTFEGLKQVVIEPESRVKIQKNNPMNDSKFKHPYFSCISSGTQKVFKSASLETSEISLRLNPYLCCIIGGRGTGKSVLLDLIKKTFNLNGGEEKERYKEIIHTKLSIVYKKTDDEEKKYSIGAENNVNYLHVSQGEVKEIVANTEKLDKEVKIMLGISEENLYMSNKNHSYIDKIKNTLHELQEEDERGQLKHSKPRLNKLIKKNKDLIQTIETKENKDLIQEHQFNQSQFIRTEKNIQLLNNEKESLESFEKEKKQTFESINKLCDQTNIPPISFSRQIEAINSICKKLKKECNDLQQNNTRIKEQLEEKGIEGDVERTFEEVTEYQNGIAFYEEELNKIDKFEFALQEQFKELKKDSISLRENLNRIIDETKSKWEKLRNGKDSWSKEQKKLNEKLIQDIDVNAEILFKKDKFYKRLSEGLNMNKFRKSKRNHENKLESIFNVRDHEDYFRLIANEKIITIDDNPSLNIQSFLEKEDFFVSDGESSLIKSLYLHTTRSEYLQVISKIKYMGKVPNQLSVGQRGTFFLRLKLATHTFGVPFIFDQPEDDLDNDFIVKNLVPILKEIKEYRQVILVTHNANVVVNSDSEQVIVAKNENEKLFYISGSIENTHIVDPLNSDSPKKMKKYICNILEGGSDAFKRREQRYDL